MKTTATTSEARTSSAADIDRLQHTIENLDDLATYSLTSIRSLALIALAAMETPDIYNYPDAFANVFLSIRDTANQTLGCIEAETGGSSCKHMIHEARDSAFTSYCKSRSSLAVSGAALHVVEMGDYDTARNMAFYMEEEEKNSIERAISRRKEEHRPCGNADQVEI
jgi:hypothetical protein